ncbi:hypothetical protein DICPUDRAFT_78376 [Dictyostelium purpureum]|uniref:Uncharacterized protein n=1 Tax=Dictyostelium purpureum TaxID=5786 RepID=F0ZJD1_DICPU|nr:uncharacterized protein DICPUDRAFT_78376 [Dictyostelium purpureum]EGC35940.1 hypothetical protein DICPUDRAFT_78376 [Dictyostelium purpureum]|eukprot:XP_003287513.1 hypothetical protein DICPUDRAFT_78376 [Dictyostelium purpureum]
MAQQIRRQQPTDREYYAISYDISTPHELGGTAHHLPVDHVQKSMYQKECSLAYAMDVAYTLPVTPGLTWLMCPCIDASHLSRMITADNMAPFEYVDDAPVENQHINQEIEQDLNNAIQQMNINNDQVNN